MTGSASGVPQEVPYYLDDRADIQALMDVRGKRVLDVGCAAGELGWALRRAGASAVVGIERVPEVAAMAREKLDAVYVGDVERSEFPLVEASFDYIVFADVLEHVVDPWSVVASFQRYLKPDGRVVASIPNLRFYAIIGRLIVNRWEYRDSGILDRTHLRFFTLPTIRQMFEQAGYRIERTECKYRLFEDQSQIGRVGALLSRWFCRFVAPFAGGPFFTFQYLVIARKAA